MAGFITASGYAQADAESEEKVATAVFSPQGISSVSKVCGNQDNPTRVTIKEATLSADFIELRVDLGKGENSCPENGQWLRIAKSDIYLLRISE